MKALIISIWKSSLVAILLSFSGPTPADTQSEYQGSYFSDVWEKVMSDPYEKLPHDRVSVFQLFKGLKNILAVEAQRTLHSRVDFREPFTKLAHPNGICLKGTWEINKENRYSGYFKNGTKALIIARASTATGVTDSGETRALGLAGKIFSTDEENHPNKVKTANFFTLDSIGGTNDLHFLDTNLESAPNFTYHLNIFGSLLYAGYIGYTFFFADKNPGMRQLYQISELGETNFTNIITPLKMRLTPSASNTVVDEKDYRNELRTSHYEEGLQYDILVSSQEEAWTKIGKMTFTESVTSASCDRRLHFGHPKWRDDLIH